MMTMRDILDQYLDGVMEPGARAELERRLAVEPALAGMLKQMKSERALRAAAMASFEPSKEEAGMFAARALAAMQDAPPVGYVGRWVRWGVGVAAGLAIVVGSFAMGRVTGGPATATVAKPGEVPTVTEAPVVYRVVYVADSGDKEVREFASREEQDEFVKTLDTTRAQSQVAAVDLNTPGSF